MATLDQTQTQAQTIGALRSFLRLIRGSPKFIIGSIGRLSHPKGYEYLIQAVPHLLKHTDNFEIQIIGDGELMADLKTLIQELNVYKHVRLLGEKNNVSQFYHEFDLFVISSISEGLPLVLLEAMACQVPILTTNVGGIPAVIVNEQSGLIVEPCQPELLADKMWYLINNEPDRLRYAANAYQTFQERFSIQKMISKYENLYLKYHQS